MAECGIEEYDGLPARVVGIDVDYLRWRLYRCDHPSFLHHIPVIGELFTPASDSHTRNKILLQLEAAKDINAIAERLSHQLKGNEVTAQS